VLRHHSGQAAVYAVQPGETALIQAGVYDAPLAVKGKNNSSKATEANRILIAADPAAPVGGVVLRGTKQKGASGDAIVLEASNFMTLRGLTITSAGGRAIVLAGGNKKQNDAIHLERNRIFGNGNSQCRSGILVRGGNTDTLIVNNLIYGTGRHGLRFSPGAGPLCTAADEDAEEGDADEQSASKGFGIKRQASGQAKQVQLLSNLICGNASGELSGPLLDKTDASNQTPTGSEGPGVVSSPGCQVSGNVYANVNGPDGLPSTADDDFTLASTSPAIDRGVDPRVLEPGVPDAIFEADFAQDTARPKDGNNSGTAEFDIGAVEKQAGQCTPGKTEECYDGPSGTKGIGQCKAGTKTCQPNGTFGSCVGEVLPTPEIAGNNIDENCDGLTPQCTPGTTQSCYTGPAGTPGVGIFHAGTQTCGTGGTFGACTGEVLPGTDIPNNGIDEDCNGSDASSGGGTLPPDPSTVAPPVEQGVVTSIGAATAFLYKGSNPIQTGVDPVTIDARRVAVLRGKVLDKSNAPLSGVTITILNHPGFGQTLTRTDGMFDLAVNGGGMVTVNYARAGYLSAQRQVQTPWQDYAWLPDVVLIPYDSRSTLIDLTATTFQVAQGSTTADTRGTRQATLLFPPGTQATMHLPDGSTQPLTVMHVRATEQSVGDNGPEATTAEEPPTAAYTYGVDFSADEAVAAKAVSVEFNQPVILYVQNFIGFPVGGGVPVGGYDNSRGLWVPHPNGRVVKVLSITNGQPTLDVKGTGQAASTADLAELGITDPELQEVGRLYSPGQILWRAPIPHFSYWDT
jgi:hypothetical protein